MLQTLLTGFGAFGRVVSNPTERLVRHFEADPEAAKGHDLTCCVLPVSFQCAPDLLRAQIEIGGRGGRPFDVILMLGVASGSPHWRVERLGRNADAPLTDADGFTPPARAIVADAPNTLSVTLPTEPQFAAIAALGLPAAFSDTAGAYLCNHALFTTLHHLKTTGHPARAGFLHVPADEETFAPGITTAPQFPFAQHVAALHAVLAALRQQTQP